MGLLFLFLLSAAPDVVWPFNLTATPAIRIVTGIFVDKGGHFFSPHWK